MAVYGPGCHTQNILCEADKRGSADIIALWQDAKTDIFIQVNT